MKSRKNTSNSLLHREIDTVAAVVILSMFVFSGIVGYLISQVSLLGRF